MRKIKKESIMEFRERLLEEEKSENTVEKYVRDVSFFASWLGEEMVTKVRVLEYKKALCEKHAPRSVNAAISSLNSFFTWMGWNDLRIKSLKIQRQIFVDKEKELTKQEYEKLLFAAKKKQNRQLYYLMQTICSTGIRVSELKYITTSAIKTGQAVIQCKGKMRVILLPKVLCKMLCEYVKEDKIKNGPVFVSRNDNPLDRSHIWKMMKSLCEKAGVAKEKVFPHNFRHLFARTHYSIEKDIVRLADILGHASINTTRIYTIETSLIHRRQIEKLGLLKC